MCSTSFKELTCTLSQHESNKKNLVVPLPIFQMASPNLVICFWIYHKTCLTNKTWLFPFQMALLKSLRFLLTRSLFANST